MYLYSVCDLVSEVSGREFISLSLNNHFTTLNQMVVVNCHCSCHRRRGGLLLCAPNNPIFMWPKQRSCLGNFFKTGTQRQTLDEIRQQITTYTDLVRQAKVLQPVIDSLQLNITVEDFNKRLDVRDEPNLPLLDISVSEVNADNAVNMANAVARLIDNGPTSTVSIEVEFRANQLRQLQSQITQLQTEYDGLIAKGATLTNAFEITAGTKIKSTLR